MSFSTEVCIKGFNKYFAVNEHCKRYTLRDNGFEETKAGNFRLVRSLDPVGSEKKQINLNLTISKDIKQLKLLVVSSDGLNTIDLYKLKDGQAWIEKFEFILDGLVDRDVLIEVEK